MTTTTINDLFSRYSDLSGSDGPVLTRDALQDDFRDWCRSRGVLARYETQGEAYLQASDGAFSDSASDEYEREPVDEVRAAELAKEFEVSVTVEEEEPVEGEGRAFWLTANIRSSGSSDVGFVARLYACPHPDGRPGLEPCGSSVEEWMDPQLDGFFGRHLAVAIAQKAIAKARVGR